MKINFHHDSIWGYDHSTWDGIDRPASEKKLVELVMERFESLGVKAQFTVSNDNPSGISDNNEDDENHAIGVAYDVWNEHEWYVEIE